MISLSEQGKKHKPYCKVESDKLTINIGVEIRHPMEDAHLIDTIDILLVSKAGLLRVKHFELTSSDEPYIEIPLEELKKGTYKIQTRCNLHGTWEDEITL